MSDDRTIIGGLMVSRNGHIFGTSIREEVGLRPVCWRCGSRLFLDRMRLVQNGEDAHPWVWTCDSCETEADRAAHSDPSGRGVK